MSNASYAPLENVRKIVVLLPSAVGDFVFALPGINALHHTYPDAELTLIGRPWHAEFLRGRRPIDRVLLMPPYPGVAMRAEERCDPLPGQVFLDQMRRERVDIAVQMYGGGRYSNPFLMRFGARLAIGARADDAPPLDRWVHYAVPNNRRLALLEVAALAGARPPPLGRELAVNHDDRREAADVLAAVRGRPLAVLQPGASDPRRCWPAERFAAVGDALARSGATVAINGTAAEAQLVRAVVATMREGALDLTGRLSLRGLCALMEQAALVVSNDTGPLHLALALGKPCVGIFWLTNLIEGTPLRQGLLRAALSVRIHCPVCGMENVRARCSHDPSFVDDVPVDQVMDMATSLLRVGAQG
jgi:ADP-heptose:LPS heptosyltransferase